MTEVTVELEDVPNRAALKPEDTEAVRGKGCLPCRNADVRKAYRNVYGLGVSMFFLVSAFQSVQNLQSSVNVRGGLGVISLSLLYAAFVISGVVTTSIVRVLGTKYAVVAGMVCHLLYIVSNYSGRWYTLIITSLCIGFGSGPLWAASSAYITQVAVEVAPIMQENQDALISQFTGVIFLFTQISHLPGNLASSVILLHASDQKNSSEISLECRNSTIEANYGGIDDTYWYILISVYVLFDIFAIILLIVVVDRAPSPKHSPSSGTKFKRYVYNPSLSTIKMLFKWRLICVGVMFFSSGLVPSFSFSIFAKEYVTDCLGLSQVGFVLMVLGLCNAVTSGVVGKIVKYIPRWVIVLIATLLNVGLIVFLLLWERTPSHLMAFLFAVGWGSASGIWNTMSSSLVGILYHSESEPAYSAARMWQASGLTVGFVMSYFASQTVFLYVLLGTILLTVILYIVVELKNWAFHIPPSLEFCLRKKVTDDVEAEELVTSVENESV